jgi:hypothetical protein
VRWSRRRALLLLPLSAPEWRLPWFTPSLPGPVTAQPQHRADESAVLSTATVASFVKLTGRLSAIAN